MINEKLCGRDFVINKDFYLFVSLNIEDFKLEKIFEKKIEKLFS